MVHKFEMELYVGHVCPSVCTCKVIVQTPASILLPSPLKKALQPFFLLCLFVLRSFQIYTSDLSAPPKRREEAGVAVAVDVFKGGRQKVGAVLS